MPSSQYIPFFPAKLLLFGEYTVLLDSQALAIPFPKFGGHWSFGEKVDERLLIFSNYIEGNRSIADRIDYQLFRQEVKANLYFKSDVPLGYGLGSSGALCAATLSRYGIVLKADINVLKTIFSQLESHFHGTSSGVDPLISYLQKPLFKDVNGWQVLDDFTLSNHDHLQFFLLDTQQARQAESFITWFTQQCEITTYRRSVEAKILPLIAELIAAIRQDSATTIFPLWHELSWLQWQLFQPMIPKFLHTIYLDSLASDWYKLKLCGAGGGGFFLGITKDIERLKVESNFPIVLI